jgi:hypothetical protein
VRCSLVHSNLRHDLNLTVLVGDAEHPAKQHEGIVHGAVGHAFGQTLCCELTGRVGSDFRHWHARFLFALVTVELVKRLKAIDEFGPIRVNEQRLVTALDVVLHEACPEFTVCDFLHVSDEGLTVVSVGQQVAKERLCLLLYVGSGRDSTRPAITVDLGVVFIAALNFDQPACASITFCHHSHSMSEGLLEALIRLIRPFELYCEFAQLLALPGTNIADLSVGVIVPALAGYRIGDRFA